MKQAALYHKERAACVSNVKYYLNYLLVLNALSIVEAKIF